MNFKKKVRQEQMLSEYQKNIIKECIALRSGGISVPMGQGKTITSIHLALKQISDYPGSMVIAIVSKTLIPSWICEIKKFFPNDGLNYVILHKDFTKDLSKIPEETKLVITTSETTAKYYKDYNIENKFISRILMNEGMFGQHEIIDYNLPEEPYCSSKLNPFHSIHWGCLIIDEIQEYTSILTSKFRGIASICTHHRWGLSGTILKESTPERILGYHLLIGDKSFPKNLPRARDFIKTDFLGLNKTMVIREEVNFDIEVIEHIKYIEFKEEEASIYKLMREIVLDLHKKVEKYKQENNKQCVRKFNAKLLGMISYLRQCLVCPMIPLASLTLDVVNLVEGNEIEDYIPNKLKSLKLQKFLENPENVESNRIKEVVNCLSDHKKVVIFTCYRTVLDMIRYSIKLRTDRKVLSIDGDMSTSEREKVIKKFNKREDVILLLTYKIGAEGLNLQSADTVMLADFEWSFGTTKQAISRVIRQGQMSSKVNTYYFVSNTGFENSLFKKQNIKAENLEKLALGACDIKKHKMKTKEIIALLENSENIDIMKRY